MRILIVLTLVFSVAGLENVSHAFCGFYVAKADSSLYNEASKVVLVRNDNKTVISMMNDFRGDMKEFAIVVPVPTVLQKGQVHVGDKAVFEHLDAYSAPRLVEYFDEDPCVAYMIQEGAVFKGANSKAMPASAADRAKALGVAVEAEYTVGEYDIVILSAKESDGLETWLKESGYKIPKGASKALHPYIKQKMKFFVAKVNLGEQAKTGLNYLRPLQFAFDSEKFMLPIRLGMINAKGPQDLLLYVLTKEGRVETTNYRTIKIPANVDIPEYVKGEFSDFYKTMFQRQVEKENHTAVFTEHFWDMGWCDPCAADPLTHEELKKLGVFWLDGPSTEATNPTNKAKLILPPGGWQNPGGGASPVLVTRLHVRYKPETFPEDLMFQETKDRQNFQGRYVLRHPWKGNPNSCDGAKRYFTGLRQRREKEAQTLANLTGWDISEIRKKMGGEAGDQKDPGKPPKWWENLWN